MHKGGGWGGIRTPEALARPPVFKTGAFNHSATHPCKSSNASATEIYSDFRRPRLLPTVRTRGSDLSGALAWPMIAIIGNQPRVVPSMDQSVKTAYRPKPEVLRRFPDISGNAVNGLGEHAFRQPKPIFWRDPDTIAHGPLQQLFYEWSERVAQYRKVTSKLAGARGPAELDPVAPTREQDTPENWAARVKDFALAHEADLVGIAPASSDWVFDDSTVDGDWIVVLGVAMDRDALAKLPPEPPDLSSADEVSRQYNRAARTSKAVTNWIRNRGWPAEAQTGPSAGSAQLIPPAIAAGLGQLGKHGSVINDTYGAAFRLSAVYTDLPLVADTPRDFGVDDFCASCRVCTNLCPPDAIFETKQWVRGVQKWYVNFDQCIPYFIDTQGCGICIAECPWSRDGVAPRLAAKMRRRRQREGTAVAS